MKYLQWVMIGLAWIGIAGLVGELQALNARSNAPLATIAIDTRIDAIMKLLDVKVEEFNVFECNRPKYLLDGAFSTAITENQKCLVYTAQALNDLYKVLGISHIPANRFSNFLDDK